MIIWKKEKDKEIPYPKSGISQDYDNSQEEILEIQKELKIVLENTRKQFKENTINFSHSKYR